MRKVTPSASTLYAYRRVWAASNYWCRDRESLPIVLICAGGVVIALLPG